MAPIALTGTCRSVPFARTTMWLTSSESGSAMTWTISPSTHRTLDLILGCRLAMAMVSGDRLFLDGFGCLDRRVLQRQQIRHEFVETPKPIISSLYLSGICFLLYSFSKPSAIHARQV